MCVLKLCVWSEIWGEERFLPVCYVRCVFCVDLLGQVLWTLELCVCDYILVGLTLQCAVCFQLCMVCLGCNVCEWCVCLASVCVMIVLYVSLSLLVGFTFVEVCLCGAWL